MEHQVKARPGRLAGKTFVFTGELPTLTRDIAAKMIEAEGGTFATAVTPDTSYLVAGEYPGTRLLLAERLGVEVIDEEDLVQLLEPVPARAPRLMIELDAAMHAEHVK